MAITSHRLASGPGWFVQDVVCTSGPGDRAFEERHQTFSIGAVLAGSFQYRTQRGSAVLVPGALLLGNHGHCYECGHEHGVGDRCIAFHFTPEFLETIVAAVPGARRLPFAVPNLPPLPALIAIIAQAEAARDAGDAGELEDLALRRDERRITAALRQIEALAHEPLSLADLSRAAAMSPYHFLRTFRAVVGMTPHQFILRTRLHRAAVQLRRSNEDISAIALDNGFNDLSTFNRRFRQLTGKTPTAYRAATAGRR
jgi:AraC family transcriptional regulator